MSSRWLDKQVTWQAGDISSRWHVKQVTYRVGDMSSRWQYLISRTSCYWVVWTLSITFSTMMMPFDILDLWFGAKICCLMLAFCCDSRAGVWNWGSFIQDIQRCFILMIGLFDSLISTNLLFDINHYIEFFLQTMLFTLWCYIMLLPRFYLLYAFSLYSVSFAIRLYTKKIRSNLVRLIMSG